MAHANKYRNWMIYKNDSLSNDYASFVSLCLALAADARPSRDRVAASRVTSSVIGNWPSRASIKAPSRPDCQFRLDG